LHDRQPSKGLLIEALTAPLLEPERSGVQIGRNRMSVIKRLSMFLADADLQVWLVERREEAILTRLGYYYPAQDSGASDLLRGQIVFDRDDGKGRSVEASPSPGLWEAARKIFESRGRVEPPQCFPVHNPIPIETPITHGSERAHPIAWIFASSGSQPDAEQLAAAKVAAFHLGILLQYGRTHRIVEATVRCSSLLYEALTLDDAFTRCAEVLAQSCAALGAGYLELVDGKVGSIRFVACDWLTDTRKKEIEQFAIQKIRASPTLDDLAIIYRKGRETQSQSFGNFLYVPIMGPSFSLESSDFVAITEADDSHAPDSHALGLDCETPSHALFLVGKKSSAYLGVNFSETDRTLCRSVGRTLSSAVYSRFFEELFLSQAKYFSSLSLDSPADDGGSIRKRLEKSLPGAKSIQLVTVTRARDGTHELVLHDRSGHLPSPIAKLVLDQSLKIHADLSRDSDTTSQPSRLGASTHFKNIQCACYADAKCGTWLIFQMSTRYEPHRFYVVNLGSSFLEKFRFHLLKHFMRELYHVHRTKDSAAERSSLLAQMRHAVVNPIAASTNNIDTFQKYLQLYARSGESWDKIRTEKEVRDLIPHAIYLNNQALLFINSGRFLFSSLGYGEIKFEQYRPVDLVTEVRLAFGYGLQERGQSWSLKIVGDANQTAVGDRLLLWIVLANLIDNAIKYGHRETEIAATLEFKADRWIFTVENTGDYLSPNLATRIFKPFERGDSAAPNINRRHGTGLGVTVSDMILRAHSDGAALKYTSDLRPGESKRAVTRFTFEMPYRLSRQGSER
jgi:signal transduction histidine kinase